MRVFVLVFSFICFSYASIDFPSLTSRVVDEANILSSQTKESLESSLSSHERNTANQVVIATIKSLQGYEIEDFSLRLARHWALGQKDKNNGVLLLIAPNERKARIEVGYGLEGVLSDKEAHEIITYTLIPAFKKGDFDGGVLAATKQILQVVNGEEFVDKKENVSSGTFNLFLIFSFVVGYLMLVVGGMFKIRILQNIGGSFFFSAMISSFLGNAFFGIFSFLAPVLLWLIVLIFAVKYNLFDSSEEDETLDASSRGFGGGSFGGFSGGFSGGGGSFGGGGASGSW